MGDDKEPQEPTLKSDEEQTKIEAIFKRFQARAKGATPAETQEAAVQARAEILEAASGDDQLDLPPQVVKGIAVFETSEGKVGMQPMAGTDPSEREAFHLLAEAMSILIVGQATNQVFGTLQAQALMRRKIQSKGGIEH